MRVTTCDTEPTLRAAGRLFDQYRQHYGQPPAGDPRTTDWLTEMVRSGMLTVYTAALDPTGDAPPIGLATAHVVPASLAMGRFWELRDLYVLPEWSRSASTSVARGAGTCERASTLPIRL